MKITTAQLRQVIREELNKKKSLNEGLSKDAISLYGWAGINTKYNHREELEKRYGNKVVDEAEKLAPKYIAFAKKVKELLKDPMIKDFAKIAKDNAGYGGNSIDDSPINGVKYISRWSKI